MKKDRTQLILEIAADQRNKTFKLYKDYKTIGEQIKQNWFKSSDAVREVGQGANKRYEFCMSIGNSRSGLLTQSYGIFLLSTLMDRFDVYFSDSEKEKYRRTLVALMDYYDGNGLDVSPYATPEINKELFGGANGEAFIESLTWLLSCLLVARRLHKSEKVKLSEEMERRITRYTGELLNKLLDNVIRSDGELGYIPPEKSGGKQIEYIGWGPVTGSIEPSLYFTCSVCDTFGDLEDTVLGNTELNIERDDEFINNIKTIFKADVIDQFKTVCAKVGAYVYKKYEDLLGNEFFYANSTVATTDQIAYSLQSPVLLNQLYVVMCAIYTNYHNTFKNNDDPDDDSWKESEEWKKFSNKIKNAVDKVYKEYRNLQDNKKESIVNREYVTFTEKHRDPNAKFCTYLSEERINVSVLEALIIKTRALIVTYVTQYPEREISDILDVILSGMKMIDDQPKWTWSELGYNLQQTERSISAIRDFYDYYDNYESAYAKVNAEKKDLEEWLEKQHKNERDNLVSDYETKLKAAEKRRKEQLERQEAQYKHDLQEIEEANKVEKAIRDLFAASLKNMLADVLAGMFDNITAYNNTFAADGEELPLSEQEHRLKNAIEHFVRSYFRKSLEDAHIETEKYSVEKLEKTLSMDFQDFVKWYAVFAAGDPDSLQYQYKKHFSSVFDLIKAGKHND